MHSTAAPDPQEKQQDDGQSLFQGNLPTPSSLTSEDLDYSSSLSEESRHSLPDSPVSICSVILSVDDTKRMDHNIQHYEAVSLNVPQPIPEADVALNPIQEHDLEQAVNDCGRDNDENIVSAESGEAFDTRPNPADTQNALSRPTSSLLDSRPSIMFPRLRTYPQIWIKSWVGLLIDPNISTTVEEYIDGYGEDDTFRRAIISEFLEDSMIMDDASAIIILSSPKYELGGVLSFLQVHRASSFAHFVFSFNSERIRTHEFFCCSSHIASKEEFIQACQKFQKFIGPICPSSYDLYHEGMPAIALEWEPPDDSLLKQWKDIIENYESLPLKESMYLAPRLYGPSPEELTPFIVMYVLEDSESWTIDISDLFKPFKPLPVAISSSSFGFKGGNREDPLKPLFIQQLEHGCSIGARGGSGTGSFGGFVELNDIVYGMTNCHVSCPPPCPTVSYGSTNGTWLVSNSDSDQHFVMTRAANEVEYLRQTIEKEKGDLAELKDELSVAVQGKNYHESAIESKRLLGRVICCSGCHATDRLDWALFSIPPQRLGRNSFPAHDTNPFVPPHPKSISLPREHTEMNRQNVVFIGRTTGRSRGFVRKLRPGILIYDEEKDIKKCRLYWSIFVQNNERAGRAMTECGDSGSWVYETKTGKPILMIVGGPEMVNDTACHALAEVFAEIEEMTHFKPKLPTYHTVIPAYTPTQDDNDIGLISAYPRVIN